MALCLVGIPLAASIGGIGALVGIAVITLLAVGSLRIGLSPRQGPNAEEARPVFIREMIVPLLIGTRGCADVSGEYYIFLAKTLPGEVPKKAIFQYFTFKRNLSEHDMAVGWRLGLRWLCLGSRGNRS